MRKSELELGRCEGDSWDEGLILRVLHGTGLYGW
jgi:hypothetical protein